MKIDKTRFLALTGMLSAAAIAACTVQNTKKDEGGNGQTPATADGGGSSSSTSDAGGSSVLDASNTTDGAGNGDADAAPACLGDNGTAPTCASSKCPTECDTVATRFKKGIAAEIAGCIEMSPTCESITTCIADKTAADADAGVTICDDATATTFCQPLVDSCQDNANNGGEEITLATCVAMAKTLTAAGRDQFTSCVTEGMAGYCTFGSSWCLDAMRY